MSDARYAIFFVPPADGALYQFGAAALGYDAYSGQDVAMLADGSAGAPEWRKLTAEPRRYGFHATLKAPFRLREGCSEPELIAHARAFAASAPALAPFVAAIGLLDGFAALLPSVAVPALDQLAESCVKEFDRFRRPLTEAERARRLAHPLSVRQIDHLERWGYPYVCEDFRFHMTLSGRLPTDWAAQSLAFLQSAFGRRQVPSEVAVEAVTVLRQDAADQPFRVLARFPLQA